MCNILKSDKHHIWKWQIVVDVILTLKGTVSSTHMNSTKNERSDIRKHFSNLYFPSSSLSVTTSFSHSCFYKVLFLLSQSSVTQLGYGSPYKENYSKGQISGVALSLEIWYLLSHIATICKVYFIYENVISLHTSTTK